MLTQTQVAAHLRSMHRKGRELIGQLTCAGALSYMLQKINHICTKIKIHGRLDCFQFKD